MKHEQSDNWLEYILWKSCKRTKQSLNRHQGTSASKMEGTRITEKKNIGG